MPKFDVTTIVYSEELSYHTVEAVDEDEAYRLIESNDDIIYDEILEVELLEDGDDPLEFRGDKNAE